MNILLLGGGGYIGSVLTGYLLSKKFKVTVIDSFIYEQNSLSNFCYDHNLQIIKDDIRKIDKYKDIIKNFELIIPLASLVGAPLCEFNNFEAKSVNLDAHLTLFKLISKNQKIIMPTTNSAYGSANGKLLCDENTPLKPISTYAEHKVLVEKDLMNHDNAISLRLATVFGMSPRMRLDLLVNDFVYRAIKDKYIVLFESNFKRNYIHVRDVCRAFLHAIENFNVMKNNIYNVGLSNANLSKKELCEKIQKYIKFEFVENEFQKDPDQRNYIVSNEKIEKTNFKTVFNIEDGIKELIKGYETINIKNFKNF